MSELGGRECGRRRNKPAESWFVTLILKAWKHCGINLFNSDIFTADDFAPSQGYSTIVTSHLPSAFLTLLGGTQDYDSDQESANIQLGDEPTSKSCEFEDSSHSQLDDWSVNGFLSPHLQSQTCGLSSADLSTETESSFIIDSCSMEDPVHVIATLRAKLSAKEEALQQAQDDIKSTKAHAIIVR